VVFDNRDAIFLEVGENGKGELGEAVPICDVKDFDTDGFRRGGVGFRY
jgi:hypothetical protein